MEVASLSLPVGQHSREEPCRGYNCKHKIYEQLFSFFSGFTLYVMSLVIICYLLFSLAQSIGSSSDNSSRESSPSSSQRKSPGKRRSPVKSPRKKGKKKKSDDRFEERMVDLVKSQGEVSKKVGQFRI